MSQLTFNAQNLANALAQLSGTAKPQAGSTSIQALPIQVSLTNSQQVVLQNPRTQQSLTVPKQNLQGNVQSGTQYRAQILPSPQSTTLNLFSQLSNPVPLQQQLTQQQFEQILRLPPSQVLAPEQKHIEIKGHISQVGPREIRVQTQDSKQTLTIPLPNSKQAATLTPGQPVTLALKNAQSHWQLQIVVSRAPVASIALTPAQQPQHAQLLSQLLAVNNQPVALSPKLQPSLHSWLGIRTDSSAAATKLTVNPKGHPAISFVGERPIASIQLDKASAAQLNKGAVAPAEPQAGQNPQSRTVAKATDTPHSSGTDVQKGNPAAKSTEQAAVFQRSTAAFQDAIQLLQRQLLPHTQSPSESVQRIISILADTNKISSPEVKRALTTVNETIKQIRAHGGQGVTPAVTLTPLADSTGDMKLSPSNTEGNRLSTPVENLRQILAAPPIMATPATLSAPTAQPGLLGGLVTLLQLTLASRITRPSSAVAEQTQQLIASLFPSTATRTPSRTQRPLSELAQLDQKHGLIKEIGKLLATHQNHKLSNAEAALQNQDTFYYVLPNLFANQQRDIELLIRREKREQQDEQAKRKGGTCWHLTMKLDVGETGQLLSKAKLMGEALEIDFYTSNDATLQLVRNYLPLLKRRLDSLGINVDKAQSQLGKIPDSLQQRPYHIFETKA